MLDNIPEGNDIKLQVRVGHPDYVSDYYWGVMQKFAQVTTATLRQQTGTIAMARGIRVSGTLTDPRGKPVAGAVVVWGDNPYWTPAARRYAPTPRRLSLSAPAADAHDGDGDGRGLVAGPEEDHDYAREPARRFPTQARQDPSLCAPWTVPASRCRRSRRGSPVGGAANRCTTISIPAYLIRRSRQRWTTPGSTSGIGCGRTRWNTSSGRKDTGEYRRVAEGGTVLSTRSGFRGDPPSQRQDLPEPDYDKVAWCGNRRDASTAH